MTLEQVRIDGVGMALCHVKSPAEKAAQLIWAHGWGQSHAAMLPLAESLKAIADSILLDFPGFGASQPPPPSPWGTAEYADLVAKWLGSLPAMPRVWIGHSFGCRVGLQLAARHPDKVRGLFLIAAAGIPRHRNFRELLVRRARRVAFRTAMLAVREEEARERLRMKFGSADYRSAGALRPTFVKVVSEDLSDIAATIRCPVRLVYGENDRETPPEIGHRLQSMIPGSELAVLKGQDHFSLLGEGRHLVAHQLQVFLGRIP